jgi:hypothetical protein
MEYFCRSMTQKESIPQKVVAQKPLRQQSNEIQHTRVARTIALRTQYAGTMTKRKRETDVKRTFDGIFSSHSPFTPSGDAATSEDTGNVWARTHILTASSPREESL